MLDQGARDLNSLDLTCRSTVSYGLGDRLERGRRSGYPRKLLENTGGLWHQQEVER
jgi:hypothetical protein